MLTRKFLFAGAALLLVLSAVACGQGGDGAVASSDMAGSAAVSKAAMQSPAMDQEKGTFQNASAPAAPTAAGQTVIRGGTPQPQLASLVTQRSVVRRAQIAVRVDNVEKAEKTVDQLTEAMGGYVDSAQSADLASENPTIDITLRVPVGQFDGALSKFEGLGVRLSKTVSSEDVTGQLVDLDARLQTLAAQEDTYRKLLRSMTSLQGVITLQDKLTEVRGEIESMAGQRKALGGLAALSTVSVHLQQSAAPVAPPTDPNWLAQVWGESTTAFGSLGRSLASIGIWLAVFSPVWVVVLLIALRITRPRSLRPKIQGEL